MSPTNVEICANCGRLLLRSEQAYLVGEKIVCAECDKLLRSEQVPQPTPSPQPSLETKKGTKKDASLKKIIFVSIGTVVVLLLLLRGFFGTKYQVEYWFEKDDKEIAAYQKTIKELKEAIEKSEPTGTLRISWKGLYESQLREARRNLEYLQKREKWFLKVRIEGPAADLVVMVTGWEGGAVCQERISREDMMDNTQTAVFEIEKENDGMRIRVIDEWSGARLLKPGDYSLVIKNFASEKVIYKTSIKLPPQKVVDSQVKKSVLEADETPSRITAEPIPSEPREDNTAENDVPPGLREGVDRLSQRLKGSNELIGKFSDYKVIIPPDYKGDETQYEIGLLHPGGAFYVFRTTDRGETWYPFPPTNPYLKKIGEQARKKVRGGTPEAGRSTNGPAVEPP